ncbi:ComEA family DNA-binding protein [Actinopolymorpha sp. NPDC004070]|uniref:ComEA family DNA-binding protein n=1 Tax=Actinopolymorpha sp. NPDC004070 TaxID=3154548 RepID=UPI0033B78EAC
MLRRRPPPQHRAGPEETARAVRRVHALRRSPPRAVVTGGWVPQVPPDRVGAARAQAGAAFGEPSSPVWSKEGEERMRQSGHAEEEHPYRPLDDDFAEHDDLLTDASEESPAWALRRGHVVVVAVVLLLAVIGAAVMVIRDRPVRETVIEPAARATVVATPGTSTSAPGSPAPRPSPTLVVHVAGKVRRPGVVHLPGGSRVFDAVTASGGALPGTDLDTVNLARPLLDGEQVPVGVTPPPGAPPAGGDGAPSAGPPSAGAPLDLNSATSAELEELPGVGPVLAQRIVDFRTEHGRFVDVEDLREVTGIGERTFAELRDKVTAR